MRSSQKGDEFAPFLKMGRTQLQDAVPMTLGQEFAAFAHTILEDVDRLGEAQALIREINMGATAIGTADQRAAPATRRRCGDISRRSPASSSSPRPISSRRPPTPARSFSSPGVLKRCAVKLSKICNDLRLLSSGPRAGFGEINLPPMQPGSSIMPGKVNPVIPEVVNQVCFDVIGGDVTVTMAAEAGQLQLNVFEPIIAYRLLHGTRSMKQACIVLRERCVDGITANPDRMRWFVEHSIGIVTALVPVLGYETATEIAKEALETGRGVYELVLRARAHDARRSRPRARSAIMMGSSIADWRRPMPSHVARRLDRSGSFDLPRRRSDSTASFDSADELRRMRLRTRSGRAMS